ncbi:MAG: DUF1640 domain-containing protein [Methylococcales bacterium]|nr:DUF1640 domain-containing protein [Methylococcales bacterium]
MTAITIDTYALISTLKDAGVPEQQAKAQIDAITKIVDVAREQIEHDHKLDDVATRRDLKELELNLNNKISDTKFETLKWIAVIVLGSGMAQVFAIIGVLKLLGKI